MQSKLLNCVVALAMLLTAPIADAACYENADGTWTCSRSAAPVQGQPVRNVARYAAAPVYRAATAPVRVVRGWFGRARYSMATPTVSSGSSGSYGSYQATQQSYGSSGGTATYEASSGSNGGLGSYGDGPTQPRATAAPVTKAAPAASVPPTGAQSCTVPPAAPSTRYCVIPPASVKVTCRVPSSGPSVEAVASL